MRPIHWVIVITIAVFIVTTFTALFKAVPVVTVQMAKVASAINPKQGFNPEELKAVEQIDPFRTRSAEVKFKEFDCVNPVPPSLPFSLISTSVLSDRSKSLAVLSTKLTGAVEVREGQMIGENIQVYQINRLQVLLQNKTNNTCELVALETP